MTSFDYVAIDTAGREQRGAVRAPSIDAARAQLGARKLYVVKLDSGGSGSAPTALLSRKITLRKRMSAKQLTLFTRQLATLVQVSPLEESLRTIARQSEEAQVARVLGNVHAGVTEGRRLSEAMTREASSFPALYRATLPYAV